MSKEKQIEEITCEKCLHHFACLTNSEYVPSPCPAYESKSDYHKRSEWISVEEISEQIIRKKAETSDYWQNDVKQYRTTRGYSDIEHDVDDFLRGYNEAVDDILAILDRAKMKGGAE